MENDSNPLFELYKHQHPNPFLVILQYNNLDKKK